MKLSLQNGPLFTKMLRKHGQFDSSTVTEDSLLIFKINSFKVVLAITRRGTREIGKESKIPVFV